MTTFKIVFTFDGFFLVLKPHALRVILKSARDSPRPPGAARVLKIMPVVLEYCLNREFLSKLYTGI